MIIGLLWSSLPKDYELLDVNLPLSIFFTQVEGLQK